MKIYKDEKNRILSLLCTKKELQQLELDTKEVVLEIEDKIMDGVNLEKD